MVDAFEHLSCAKCGRIFHAEDLDELGLCPACSEPPPPPLPSTEEEQP